MAPLDMFGSDLLASVDQSDGNKKKNGGAGATALEVAMARLVEHLVLVPQRHRRVCVIAREVPGGSNLDI